VLGNPTLDATRNDHPSTIRSLPIAVVLPPTIDYTHIAQVAAGSEHTLLLTVDGQIFAFGSNRFGQLGTGDRSDSAQAVRVHVDRYDRRIQACTSVFSTSPVTSIACGFYHSLCTTADGHAYTWGWAVHGQLGHGSRLLADQLTPRPISALRRYRVFAVAGGQAHSVFASANGHVYTCGSGVYGQLGRGANLKKLTTPERVVDMHDYRVSRIDAGQFNCVAWTECRRLFTWGSTPHSLKFRALMAKRSRHQQQDTSTTTKTTRPVETTCVIDTDTSHMCVSELVDLPASLLAEDVVHIACGSVHTALLTGVGSLYTFGKSMEYQLGHGDRIERVMPSLLTTVNDVHQWTHVACGKQIHTYVCVYWLCAGGDYTMAVDKRGRVWGWGRNDVHQLGFNSTTTPVHTGTRSPAKSITIQRAGGNTRTIKLPTDAQRVFAIQPTKLIAIRAHGFRKGIPY
jgi:hypothetical protein